jgi:DNA-binding SARP family transcriptional activator
MHPRALAATDGRPAAELSLAGEFELVVSGRRLVLPHTVERVVAYLALSDRPVSRAKLAGILWIDTSEPRAASNLRTALWRLHRIGGGRLIDALDDRLALTRTLAVDIAALLGVARRLIDGDREIDSADIARLEACTDLLPDWGDEWIVTDRERFRLLRLEALEHAAELLLERKLLGRALEAALAVVASEPLRESGRRLMVRVQIAEGNVAEAIRGYREYRALLRDEIGLDPSPAMETLVQGLK